MTGSRWRGEVGMQTTTARRARDGELPARPGLTVARRGRRYEAGPQTTTARRSRGRDGESDPRGEAGPRRGAAISPREGGRLGTWCGGEGSGRRGRFAVGRSRLARGGREARRLARRGGKPALEKRKFGSVVGKERVWVGDPFLGRDPNERMGLYMGEGCWRRS